MIHCILTISNKCINKITTKMNYSNPKCFQFTSVKSHSHVWLFATRWTAKHQTSLSITNSWSWLKLMSIEMVIPSNNLILCRHLLLLPSIFPSIKVLCSESVLHIRWPKYWSFNLSIRPFNEYSRLTPFRTNWFDLLAVQGTLKSLFQHHSSKESILQCSASFMVQLSHPYMTTGKTIALTRWTFVGKVMSLICNIVFRIVIAFLAWRKQVLISWLQSPCSNFGAQENKVSHCFHCFPISLPWSGGTRFHDLSFLMLSFKPAFLLSSFTFIKRIFSCSSFLL